MLPVCTFSNATGTLTGHYVTDKKTKLKYFTFEESGKTTEISLSKVWVNGFPVIYLKGFRSMSLGQEAQFIVQDELCDITLQNQPFTLITLTVTVDTENKLDIQVPENLKITGLRKIIAKKLNIEEAATLGLKHQGYPLDGSLTLADSGFSDGTDLVLQSFQKQEVENHQQEKLTSDMLESGGMCKEFKFVTPEQAVAVSLVEQTRKWKQIGQGLNLKAICSNKACAAFKQVVYIQKGIGTFNIAEECSEAACPECKQNPNKEPNNCGFQDCIYSIKGRMEDNTLFEVTAQIAPQDAFVTFEEIVDGQSKMTQWKYLKITVEPPVRSDPVPPTQTVEPPERSNPASQKDDKGKQSCIIS